MWSRRQTGEQASKTNSSPLSNVQNHEVSDSAENHYQNLLGHFQGVAEKEGHDSVHRRNPWLRTPRNTFEERVFPRRGVAGALQHLLSMNRGQKGMPGYPVVLCQKDIADILSDNTGF